MESVVLGYLAPITSHSKTRAFLNVIWLLPFLFLKKYIVSYINLLLLLLLLLLFSFYFFIFFIFLFFNNKYYFCTWRKRYVARLATRKILVSILMLLSGIPFHFASIGEAVSTQTWGSGRIWKTLQVLSTIQCPSSSGLLSKFLLMHIMMGKAFDIIYWIR